MRDYNFDQKLEDLKDSLYNSYNISREILGTDYLINDNLADDYVEKLFEIPLEILKLIRKI